MKKAFLAAAVALLIATFWAREGSPHNPVITTVTFNREIASLFERKCLSCHTEDGLAMPLGMYTEARPWAVAIKEEILARRMPPWPAERGYGEFANDIGLTAREFDFLISWVDGGVPKGTGDDRTYADHRGHWMLGPPDVRVTASRGITVAPQSPAGLTRITFDPGFRKDRWIRAVDFKPGDNRVVRAAFFTLAETGQYLGGWTPWHATTELPDGVAFKIPARSTIVVDVLHSGATETIVDRPTLGLYSAKAAPASPAMNILLEPQASGRSSAANTARASAEITLAAGTTLLALRPELGSGGKSIEIKARRPDGSVQVLVWIKNFRREWQTPYILRQPIALPKGSSIQATAYFDKPTETDSVPPFKVTFTAYEPR